MSEHNLYDSVGTAVGKNEETGEALVGLLYPTETTIVDGECEEKYISLAAVKSLLIDLRDAIDAAEKIQRGEDPGEW